ncbi:MAG: response regulator transcription factor [Pyrinomonadaceae bacterium]
MRRILCVDNDTDSLEIARLTLLRSDPSWSVDCSGGVVEAQRRVNANGPYDLYVIDYWMPDRCGLELCRWIRSFDKTAAIVIHTAAVRPVDRDAAIEAGADHFLAKPTGITELGDIARQLLSRAAAEAVER